MILHLLAHHILSDLFHVTLQTSQLYRTANYNRLELLIVMFRGMQLVTAAS